MEIGIVFLGTSAAMPTPRRGLPCIAVIYKGAILLLDIGEGCQYSLQRAGLSPLRVKLIAISHLHGDHLFGLPGLIQSMSMANRRSILTIIGPRGLANYISQVFNITGHIPPFPIRVDEVSDGKTYLLENELRITAFRVEHIGEAYGYIIEEAPRKKIKLDKLKELGLKPGPFLRDLREGRDIIVEGTILKPSELVEEVKGVKIVYTGDTKPTERVVKAANRATVLIHDATFTSRYRDKAYSEGHSTAADAAILASLAKPDLLVLTHISARFENDYELLKDAERYFKRTVIARDFMKIVIR